MPKPIAKTIKPYWTTSDNQTVKLYQGNVESVLSGLPAKSVHCVVTSPPYWGLRDYETDKTQEIGSEKTPQLYVDRMVQVFREVRRVLRDDGTLWLNLGDTYGGGLKSGNLVGIPWRVALALQEDGWILRQDIVWCLSGGTWLYVRSQKGDMPMMVRDLARLDPSTVRLWNGKRWTRLLGMNQSKRNGSEIELVLRSGERISCTSGHGFPTSAGSIREAKDLKIGDKLTSCRLPEPDNPLRADHLGNDAAWFAGLYLAEGCGADKGKIQIAGHRKELGRWNRVLRIVQAYGGKCTLTMSGSNQTIRVYGKVICAVVKELVTGKDAKTKGFSSTAWRHNNRFIRAMMEGYLSGDGYRDRSNDRWRIGFARNYNLERDLRTACARLGWTLTLNPTFADYSGQMFPSFRGEIRTVRSGHQNEKDCCEIVEIRSARCREVYDIGVEDAPNAFALASGVLTHNSKPSPMPESVKSRCTKAHEYIFLLVKRMGYFYDAEAIKEKSKGEWNSHGAFAAPGGKNESMALQNSDLHRTRGLRTYHPGIVQNLSNKRSVWTISSQGYDGAHFATYPPKLIEPCILAGTSEKGCCAECGAPWKRVVEISREETRPGNKTKYGTVEEDIRGGDGLRLGRLRTDTTIGWEATCQCEADVEPCVVLDPFIGSGTTCCVAVAHGRRSIGIDLSEKYLRNNAIPRIEGELLKRGTTCHLIRREVQRLNADRWSQ